MYTYLRCERNSTYYLSLYTLFIMILRFLIRSYTTVGEACMLHTDGHDVAWSLCLRNVVGPSSVPTLRRCNRMQCRAASSETDFCSLNIHINV